MTRLEYLAKLAAIEAENEVAAVLSNFNASDLSYQETLLQSIAKALVVQNKLTILLNSL